MRPVSFPATVPAVDDELDRVSVTSRQYREGVNADGSRYAEIDGVGLHGTRRLIPIDWVGRILVDHD